MANLSPLHFHKARRPRLIGRGYEEISCHDIGDKRGTRILRLGNDTGDDVALRDDPHEVPFRHDRERPDVLVRHERRRFTNGRVRLHHVQRGPFSPVILDEQEFHPRIFKINVENA